MPPETRTTTRSPRQKACAACTRSKRRCDRTRPVCERCIDRDIVCVYPLPKKRRFNALFPPPQQLEAATVHSDTSAQTASNECCDPISSESRPGRLVDSNHAADWFLAPETWFIQHDHREAPGASTAVIKNFLRGVHGMMRTWAREGSNAFIHAELYNGGLPQCLQDAYTTLTAYMARTPATEDMVLQIAEGRTTALVALTLPASADLRASVLAHLSRAQALFVYQVIRLLDGDVRQRTLAEAHIATLYGWIWDVWQAACAYQTSLLCCFGKPIRSSAGKGPGECSMSPTDLWSAWVLTESARRTFLVAGITMNVYDFLRDGWTACVGLVMLTARKGLWGAPSAARWLDLCRSKDPWLVSLASGHKRFAGEELEEVDDLACHILTLLSEGDDVQAWVERSKRKMDTASL
jgi:hypothetical protein